MHNTRRLGAIKEGASPFQELIDLPKKNSSEGTNRVRRTQIRLVAHLCENKESKISGNRFVYGAGNSRVGKAISTRKDVPTRVFRDVICLWELIMRTAILEKRPRLDQSVFFKRWEKKA